MDHEEIEQLVDSIANVAVRMRDEGARVATGTHLPRAKALQKERDLLRSSVDQIAAICKGAMDNTPAVYQDPSGPLRQIHETALHALDRPAVEADPDVPF